MGRTMKVAISLIVLVALAALAVVALAYREFFLVAERFDADFYAAAPASGGGNLFHDGHDGHDAYADALGKYVDDDGMVDYAGLKADRGGLDDFSRAIARLDRPSYDEWDDSAKIAFWINAYNALTLKAIIDHYPIKGSFLRNLAYPRNSIRQIPGVWDKLQFLVMGEKMTLAHIEHSILRAKFSEPRIHMALVCAAMGCPPLLGEPYVGAKLEGQLDGRGRRFMSDPAKFRIDRSAGRVYLSSIFNWFGGDFVDKYTPGDGFAGHDEPRRATLNFAAGYLFAEDAEFLRDGKYGVEYLHYDWSLNEQPRAETK